MKKIKILIVLLGTYFCIEAQTIIFVNKNVQGGLQNGSNWSNAFPDLQQALAVAADGNEIWVAAATYYPTPTTDRSVSFVLKQGVKMYGGFSGTETDRSQRDFALNETILSGNIGTPNGTDNTYHILYGTGVDSNTIVDGFVVSRGGATSAAFPHFRGGGLYLIPSPNLYNTCPVIQNCRFEYNSASSGAAIFCNYEYGNVVNPVIRNCDFMFNRATNFAGGLYKSGPALPDKPFVVENCRFVKNSAITSEGGGALLTSIENTTIFRNCTFEKDSSWFSQGGGLLFAGFASTPGSGSLILDSCNFIDNYAQEGTGLIFTDLEGGNFFCKMNSCRFEGNKSENGDGSAFFMASYQSGANEMDIDIQNTVFTNNLSGTYYNIYISAGFNSYLKAKFRNCKFLNNKNLSIPNQTKIAIGAGIGGGNSNGELAIENCLFAHNGGGIAVLCGEESDMQTNITNCTFYHNNRFIVDKTWFPIFDTSDVYRNDCYITNCIFWEPDSNIDQMFTNNNFTNVNMYDYYIDYTLTSLTNTNIPGGTEAFGNHVIFNTYPVFADTATGDFRLLPCSPAVNKGDNVAVDSINLTNDLEGNPRIYRDTVDLGAYEVQDTCQTNSTYEQMELTEFHLFPNPVLIGSELFVQLLSEHNHGKLNWTIMNACGKQIMKGDCVHFSPHTFNIPVPKVAGVYFLQIRSVEQSIQLKFIVL